MHATSFRSPANAGGQESRVMALLVLGPRFRGGTENRGLRSTRYAGIDGSSSRSLASIASEY